MTHISAAPSRRGRWAIGPAIAFAVAATWLTPSTGTAKDLLSVLALAGKHPMTLASDPVAGVVVRKTLGVKFGDYFDRLKGPASGLQVVDGRWVVGIACMVHSCGSDEAFAAFDTQTGALAAALLDDGVITLYRSSDDAWSSPSIRKAAIEWQGDAAKLFEPSSAPVVADAKAAEATPASAATPKGPFVTQPPARRDYPMPAYEFRKAFTDKAFLAVLNTGIGPVKDDGKNDIYVQTGKVQPDIVRLGCFAERNRVLIVVQEAGVAVGRRSAITIGDKTEGSLTTRLRFQATGIGDMAEGARGTPEWDMIFEVFRQIAQHTSITLTTWPTYYVDSSAAIEAMMEACSK